MRHPGLVFPDAIVNVPSRFQGRVPGLEKGVDFFEVDTGGPVTGFHGTRKNFSRPTPTALSQR